ncbi:MAG: 1-acyl-sn-glycerol-3-phosphate acyltransferase [Spirochaetales bacterium]|nr:1-acyl-sn-glycerol-3-phosphate acyltransferase [Spirochaetales bacterium]
MFRLRLQILLSYLAFPVLAAGSLAYLFWVRRYHFADLEHLRRTYKEMRGPVIVVANHLNMLDSLLIHHALGSVKDYVRNFRLLVWNLPAAENFKTTLFLSLYTYLGKCIAVNRAAPPEEQRQLTRTLSDLVRRGERLLIFPEGGRSRTGRLDAENWTYGAGTIIAAVDDLQVLCLYLRSRSQGEYGFLPERGSILEHRFSLIRPRSGPSGQTDLTGMRLARYYARQLLAQMQALEHEFFTSSP